MSENAITITTSTDISSSNEFNKKTTARIKYSMKRRTTEDVDPFLANVIVAVELENSESLTMDELHAAAIQKSYDFLVRLVSELESQRQ